MPSGSGSEDKSGHYKHIGNNVGAKHIHRLYPCTYVSWRCVEFGEVDGGGPELQRGGLAGRGRQAAALAPSPAQHRVAVLYAGCHGRRVLHRLVQPNHRACCTIQHNGQISTTSTPTYTTSKIFSNPCFLRKIA